MNSIFLPSSNTRLTPPLPLHRSTSHLPPPKPLYSNSHHHFVAKGISFRSFHSLNSPQSPFAASSSTHSNEGAVSVINYEDFLEKDWSFLENPYENPNSEITQKIDSIICAGDVKPTSRVLISIGSEGFVDRVVESSPCEQLLVVHDSLFILAFIKEKYDQVKCWQGELIYVPQKWVPFDVVFLYFLPALPFELTQVFEVLAKNCLPGGRIVISHPGGRLEVEEQRKLYPDVVVSDLPDKSTLLNVASDKSFEMVEFVDEPSFYLAVLRLKELTA